MKKSYNVRKFNTDPIEAAVAGKSYQCRECGCESEIVDSVRIRTSGKNANLVVTSLCETGHVMRFYVDYKLRTPEVDN